MSRRESGSLGDNYPAFHAFGPEPRLLTHEDAISATPDERIASVWRYLVRRASRFISTLKLHERSNFDVEDILMELYMTLREKDAKWDSGRGKYITFVGKITDRELSDIRDRSRTVESPRNSSCRMREYQAEEDGGTITDRRAKTFDDIRRSSGEYMAIAPKTSNSGGRRELQWEPVSAGADQSALDSASVDRDAVLRGLAILTPFESACVGRLYGLWGAKQRTIAEIAEDTGRSRDAVKKAKESASQKIRRRLYDMGHPAVASDN